MTHTSVIAIDGPAGSGKTTIARRVATHLGWLHIDTGAMYRALTWMVLDQHVDPDDARAVMCIVRTMQLHLELRATGPQTVTVNGHDVTRRIRQPRITAVVSRVSRHRRVRSWMVTQQRAAATRGPIVMEGRDIGTVVFPKAQWKFFLVASVAERVRRRYRELRQSGKRVTRAEVAQDVKLRDRLDRHRPVGALRRAEDAVQLNTTHLTITQVVRRILVRVSTPAI